MNAADDKIEMMKVSIRCLVFGLLALLPVIGVAFALVALWISGEAYAREQRFWNPARRYRLIGVASAVIGAVVWTIVDTVLIFHFVRNYLRA